MHSTDKLEDEYLGSGKILKASIAKYGEQNFKRIILEELKDRNSLKKREEEIVNEEIINDPLCMNLQLGGGGGLASEEHKTKWNTAGNKKQKWLYENDPEWKEKRKAKSSSNIKKLFLQGKVRNWSYNYSWKGKTHKKETIKLMSKKRQRMGLKEKNSQFGTCWITNGIENKKIKKTNPIPENWKYGRKYKGI